MDPFMLKKPFTINTAKLLKVGFRAGEKGKEVNHRFVKDGYFIYIL